MANQVFCYMHLNDFQDAVAPPFERVAEVSRRTEYDNPPRSPFFKGGSSVARHPANCSDTCFAKVLR